MSVRAMQKEKSTFGGAESSRSFEATFKVIIIRQSVVKHENEGIQCVCVCVCVCVMYTLYVMHMHIYVRACVITELNF